jgi:succinate-semialdehyde dehydrogenase / glutarate-semialdehyde dehydrogenase
MTEHVQLFIGGEHRDGTGGATLAFRNPATGADIGTVAIAAIADLDRAVAAAGAAFPVWRETAAWERARILRAAAGLLRTRADAIGELLTREQGKPFAQARQEVVASADILDWLADEAPRVYGRVIPARGAGVQQMVLREPVGVVAAFTPWNFPVSQAVRKVGAALAAGCSIILKGPEETPASVAALIGCLHDAGVPLGTVNLVYGVPAEISEHLIPHPLVRKISFTGSTAVGKHLAALAGRHMKRATMELGGHSPTLVFDDADLDTALDRLAAFKFRNAGQVCASPTRLLVQRGVYGRFLDGFVERARALRVGDGIDPATEMGPLANARRVQALEDYVADARQHGATVATGGQRIGNRGYFFEPTVLTDVPKTARIMNEEPFGPIVMVAPFDTLAEAMTEANRLDYGLAAFAYTRSAETARAVTAGVESGMVSINHHGLALPETPFGGVKDSGYGSEGGSESLEPYLVTKFVTHAL